MDTVTHALIGRLAGQAFLPEGPEKRGLKNWMTGLAALPDADFLMSIGQPVQELVNHRGLTHSLLGVAVMAIPLGWLMRRGVRGQRPLPYYMVLAAVTMLFAHVFYDVATSYGTQILRPFSDLRVALDWHFILDPFLTGIVIAGLLAGRAAKKPLGEFPGRRPQRSARRFFALMLLYTFTMGGLHYLAVEKVRQQAQADRLFERAHALPAPFSPLHWQGIAAHAHMYTTHPIALAGAPGGQVRSFVRVDNREDGIWGAIWAHPDGKIYRWFARYITGEFETREDGGTSVHLLDLQFRPNLNNLGVLGNAVLTLLGGIAPEIESRLPFQARIEIAPDGTVESFKLLSPIAKQ